MYRRGPVTAVASEIMDNVIALRPRAVADLEQPCRPEQMGRPEPLWREVLGAHLRAERRERGERIADVAGRAGISPQYLSEVERGRKDPSSEILSAVAGALGLSVLQVTRRAGEHLNHLSRNPRGPVCLAA